MNEATAGASPATEDSRALPCMEGHVSLLVTGEHTEGQFALIETVECEGCWHPLHVHSREDELVYVLEGQVQFHMDGIWITRRAGESMILPRGREHTYATTSNLARLLILMVPAGLEGYYRELGQPVNGPCVYQDAERLVIVAARYGIDTTGPPPPLESQSQ